MDNLHHNTRFSLEDYTPIKERIDFWYKSFIDKQFVVAVQPEQSNISKLLEMVIETFGFNKE